MCVRERGRNRNSKDWETIDLGLAGKRWSALEPWAHTSPSLCGKNGQRWSATCLHVGVDIALHLLCLESEARCQIYLPTSRASCSVFLAPLKYHAAALNSAATPTAHRSRQNHGG